MVLRDVNTGERTEIPVTGVFVAIGHTPNTSLFRGQIETRRERLHRDPRRTRRRASPACSRAGTFRITSIARRSPRRGQGCMAAIDAEHYLDHIPEHLQSV